MTTTATTNPKVPPTMRAQTFSSRGPAHSVLRRLTLPSPQPSSLRKHEALIKVSHAIIMQSSLLLFRLLPHYTSRGIVPEHEFGGTIVAMGEGGRDGKYVFASASASASADAADSEDSEDWNLRVGDQVLGFLPFSERFKGHGAMAEYIVCPMEYVVRKPRNQSLLEASGVLANGWTAVHSGDAAGVKKGDKALLNGCSGLLGSLLVQVVKGIVGEEGTVVGVCSAKNEAFVKGLGVDEVIDYTSIGPLHTFLSSHPTHSTTPFDAIFDVIGNKPLHDHCPAYLAQDGLYDLLGAMTYIANPSWLSLLSFFLRAKTENYRPVIFGGVPRRHRMDNTLAGQQEHRRVVRMVEAGKLRVMMDGVWTFEDAREAYERVETQRARGKVVVAVGE